MKGLFKHKNAFIYFVSMSLSRLGSFLLIPLYTHKLSTLEYGEFTHFQIAMSLVPLLITLGLPLMIPKAALKGGDHLMTLAVSMFVLCLLALILGEAWVMLFDVHWTLVTRQAMHAMVAAIALGSFGIYPDMVLRTEQRAKEAALFQLFVFGINVLLPYVFVVTLGKGLEGALMGFSLAQVIVALVGMFFAWVTRKGAWNKTLLKGYYHGGVHLLPHASSSWMLGVGERWLMRFLGAQNSLGTYTLAAQLSQPAPILLAAWNDERSPKQGGIYESEGALGLHKQLPLFVKSYMVVAGVASLIVLGAGAVFILGFTPLEYHDALVWLPFLVMLVFADALYLPSSNTLYYSGHEKTISMVSLSAAGAALLLSLLLIPAMGVFGAVCGKGLANAGRAAIMWWMAKHLTGGTHGLHG